MGFSKIIFFLPILIMFDSFYVNAQKVKPFFGITYNLNNSFHGQAYYSLNSGIQYDFKRYFKPEFEISYFIGKFDDNVNYDTIGIASSLFSSEFNALNFSFIPKVTFLIGNNKGCFFYIFPKYNFSKVKAIGVNLLINPSENIKFLETKQVFYETKHSLGFGTGFVTNLFGDNSDAIALNLYFQNLDFGSVINKLNYKYDKVNTKNVLGFGVIYYFNTKAK